MNANQEITVQSGGMVVGTGGAASGLNTSSYGTFCENGTVSLSSGAVVAKTLANTNAFHALNKQPTLPSSYKWRLADGATRYTLSTATPYLRTGGQTYVELRTMHAATLAASPLAGGTVTGGGVYGLGESVTVTATPAANYRFARWEITPAVTYTSGSATTATATFAMPGEDVTATAVFVPVVQAAITVRASNPAYGTVTGGGTYGVGTPVTVTATPAANYRFVQWTENGVQVSTQASYRFTVTDARTLEAEFAAKLPPTASAQHRGWVCAGGVDWATAACGRSDRAGRERLETPETGMNKGTIFLNSGSAKHTGPHPQAPSAPTNEALF